MTLTSVHKEDRRRAYLEVVWKGPHQAREEAGLKQVEESQGVRRRQILDGDAQGGEEAGIVASFQPAMHFHFCLFVWPRVYLAFDYRAAISREAW